jgi:hypothetical protein
MLSPASTALGLGGLCAAWHGVRRCWRGRTVVVERVFARVKRNNTSFARFESIFPVAVG